MAQFGQSVDLAAGWNNKYKILLNYFWKAGSRIERGSVVNQDGSKPIYMHVKDPNNYNPADPLTGAPGFTPSATTAGKLGQDGSWQEEVYEASGVWIYCASATTVFLSANNNKTSVM